ncbi:hypothetical protein RHECNPAF_4300140 [Rhizobium etli CNPAF512]|nr:hypothetical protein RHECNPAF_4300140 [Rhizobium etli CNPAF512]
MVHGAEPHRQHRASDRPDRDSSLHCPRARARHFRPTDGLAAAHARDPDRQADPADDDRPLPYHRLYSGRRLSLRSAAARLALPALRECGLLSRLGRRPRPLHLGAVDDATAGDPRRLPVHGAGHAAFRLRDADREHAGLAAAVNLHQSTALFPGDRQRRLPQGYSLERGDKPDDPARTDRRRHPQRRRLALPPSPGMRRFGRLTECEPGFQSVNLLPEHRPGDVVTQTQPQQRRSKMYKILLVSGALALSSFATNALADGAVTGAAGGAITGAIVGGPVGAAVGGIAGGVAGAVVDPPPREVVTYVQQQPAPTARVVVQEPIVVGKPLPADVVVTPVPDNPKYAYTVINNQHVIVEPRTHRVVQVIE